MLMLGMLGGLVRRLCSSRGGLGLGCLCSRKCRGRFNISSKYSSKGLGGVVVLVVVVVLGGNNHNNKVVVVEKWPRHIRTGRRWGRGRRRLRRWGFRRGRARGIA